MFVNDIKRQYEATMEMLKWKILFDANHMFKGRETGGIGSVDFTEPCKAVIVVVPDH